MSQWDDFERLAALETDECIVWPHGTNSKGYGRVTRNYRTIRTHVEVCVRRHGPRPTGMYAAHLPIICHNRACMNHRHLRWATPTENYHDMALDGTLNAIHRGTPRKLTSADVEAIRSAYAAGGCSYSTLGRQYGVNQAMIAKIITGKSWAVRQSA